jgi:ketosteroid isomerase-like protein
MQPKAGKPVQDVGKSITVFKKQPDGSYKSVRDIFNSDLPPAK